MNLLPHRLCVRVNQQQGSVFCQTYQRDLDCPFTALFKNITLQKFKSKANKPLQYSCVLFLFTIASFLPLCIYQANMADYMDNQWVTCFQESAEAILGQNAAYLGQLKDSVRLSFQNTKLFQTTDQFSQTSENKKC